MRAVALEEPARGLRAADRHHRDALGVEIPPVPLGERLERGPVAQPLDEDDGVQPCGS